MPSTHLPLRFQPGPMTHTAQVEKEAALSAPAPLLLSAAGARLEGTSGEH